jgi:hypothetical protein
MSTKIFNGWVIDGVDMVTTLAKLRQFQKSVRRIVAGRLCSETARRAAFVIDKYRITGKKVVLDPSPRANCRDLTVPTGSYFMFDTRDWIIHDSFESEQKSYYAYECDVTLFPIRKGRKSFTLLLLFDNSAGAVYTRSFTRIFKPRRYDYWDNVDSNPAVSEREWAERGRVWDSVLGYDSPAESGFTFNCVTKCTIPTASQGVTFNSILPPKDRQKNVYSILLADESLRAAAARLKDVRYTSNLFEESRRWRESPAGTRYARQLLTRVQGGVREIYASDYSAPLSTYAMKEDANDAEAAK